MKIRKFPKFCYLVVTRGKTRYGSIVKYFLIALLTLVLAVTWGNPALGQNPSFILGNAQNRKAIVNFFNRPYPCGNLVCAKIWLNGVPISEIAAEPVVDADSDLSVELRAKKIQNNFQQIIATTIAAHKNYIKESSPLLDSAERTAVIGNDQESVSASSNSQSKTTKPSLQPETDKQQVDSEVPNLKQNISQISTDKKRLHPNTPEVKAKIINGEALIYIPEQSAIPFQDILTITKADVIHHGQLIEELTQEYIREIRFYLNLALIQRDLETQYPFLKPGLILGLFFAILLFNSGATWMRKRSQTYYQRLKRELHELEQSLAIAPESVSNEQLAKLTNKGFSEDPRTLSGDSHEKKGIAWDLLLKFARATGNFSATQAKKSAPKALWYYLTFNPRLRSLFDELPKLSLKMQNMLKQRLNLILLFLQTLVWMQALILVWGTAFIFVFYSSTRAFGVLLIIRSLPIIGIWVLITLADKVSNILVDFLLDEWAKNEQVTHEYSPRYALRVSTYSAALKNSNRVIFSFIGIIWAAEILGIATKVLASAGIIAIAITYFLRNLVKDTVNGLLILLSDRYAVGDWIVLDNVSGAVEKMNLHLTELRNADGDLITIPNGSITVVKNMSKDWSRVNFSIEIAYNANINRALQLLREVFEQMYAEPEWGENILGPIEVLGIDQVSHAGVIIRVWIKTLPLKQWFVGREFRWRVKQAFDCEDIAIGVPQQFLSVTNYPYFANSNSSRKEGIGNEE